MTSNLKQVQTWLYYTHMLQCSIAATNFKVILGLVLVHVTYVNLYDSK